MVDTHIVPMTMICLMIVALWPNPYDTSPTGIKLKLIWIELPLKPQTNNIFVFCINQRDQHEILIEFTKDGFFTKAIKQPKIWFKCFEFKQLSDNDSNSFLYEIRSNGIPMNESDLLNCQLNQKFDPQNPTSLPLFDYIQRILSTGVVIDKFKYENRYDIQVIHRQRIFYLDDRLAGTCN
ncbi:unnamed protein product [Didymodactylos carnosus]|uniref:Uncharacterized protein n=1 Tax=Didymodactylos carnosus TaxID=1234261 RepID=A0A816AM81_9BILA|nr:unnamed protein product [Didymodactylos carnosus]CAF4472948.1 unnamed protein product [Didymodactylos carnosus]